MTVSPAVRQPRLALVIDDDDSLRLMLRAKLEQDGMRVEEARDAAEGLVAFDRHHPDIVLLDVVMPGMDGFEACRALRARNSGQRTPILMLTSLDDVDSVDRAYRAGATDFLPKPIHWPMFGHRIRYILRMSGAVNELAASQARLAKSQSVARLGSWEWEAASDQFHHSSAIHEIAGVEAGLFPATIREALSLVHPADQARVREAAAHWLQPGSPTAIEFRLLRHDGTSRAVLCQTERECDEAGRLVRLHGIVQDITDRKQSEARIRRLAYFDAVTGLPNRAWLLERLDGSIESARRQGKAMAVLFLDIDHFKRINDTLGHGAGDATLKMVARRIERAVRRDDVVGRVGAEDEAVSIARLGGDEFCILLGSLGAGREASLVAKRLLDTFLEPFVIDGFESYLSASIGVAVYPQDGEDGESLLKAADAAMYHAKDEGRNNVQHFTPALNQRAIERLTLESDLRRALERDEFTLHFQPQVDERTRRVVGLEALVRWNHPTRGLLPPGQFIAVAEECRQIVRVDAWVLRNACRQNRLWQDAGLRPLPVSVNLSGHHFTRATLVDEVSEALAESGLDPAWLTLEVTESVLMADHALVSGNLQRLREMGVRLSLDDFGTGYSSLSYLKRLPFDELKIDQSFTRDIVADADSAAIVSAIVAVGRTLGLKLVAEGVETEGQAQCLRRAGCEVLQGFLHGRPQPAAAIEAMLRPGEAPALRLAAGAPALG